MKKRKDSNGRVLPDGVAQRADGRYLYRYQLNGKPVYIYDKDLNSLKQKIAKFQMDIINGINTDIGKMTLNEWYYQYLEIYKKDKLKASSYQNSVCYYRRYVENVGMLGRMRIKDIHRSHVIAHFKMLAEKKNLANGTLKGVASSLHGCFQQVLYDNAITYNPMDNIMTEIQGKPRECREALEENEVAVMVEFLKQDAYYNIYLPLVVVGLSTGLRCGELVGLTWKDIDFKKKEIHVEHTLQYRNRGNGGHEFFITTPKTENSIRTIPMTSEVEMVLQQQRRYQKEMRIRDDIEIDGYSKFIFTTKLGNPFTNDAVGAILKRIIKQANIWEEERARKEKRSPVMVPEHTPHYWRHTFCTRLVEAEVPYEELMNLMGHGNINTTLNVYTHITEKLKKRSRISLEKVISVM